MSEARARDRLDALAERLRARARGLGSVHDRQTLRGLFTRDVTSRELRQLIEEDPQEIFRYFTRGIDFAALEKEPWHRRYPRAAWQVFLALAYRLSPARRVMFAAAVLFVFGGWVHVVLTRLFGAGLWQTLSGFELALLAATALFFLLLLELRDKLTLKGDLEIAREIQFGLLPCEPLHRDGISVHTAMRPANTVGGDYFDLIELGEGRFALVVADVAGKGIPAALLMALLQASLRTLINAGFRGTELLEQLDRHLYRSIPSNRLVTCFYGELEPASGQLHYINAGHNPPLLVDAGGRARPLPATAVVLGAVADQRFESGEVQLQRGERLFLYTDGLTEAFDEKDREYGEERLSAFLSRHRERAPAALIAGLLEDVLAFCGKSRPHDDMTLMLVSRSRQGEIATGPGDSA